MGHAGSQSPHGSQLFGIDKLAFQFLVFRNIPGNAQDRRYPALFIFKGHEVGAQPSCVSSGGDHKFVPHAFAEFKDNADELELLRCILF